MQSVTSWHLCHLKGYITIANHFNILPWHAAGTHLLLNTSVNIIISHSRHSSVTACGLLWRKRSVTMTAENLCNAAVTCEIKLFWNNFEIISVFYFTCNHGWNWNKIISAGWGSSKIISKSFQHNEHVGKYSSADAISLWNNFEASFPRAKIKLFQMDVDEGWNNFILHGKCKNTRRHSKQGKQSLQITHSSRQYSIHLCVWPDARLIERTCTTGRVLMYRLYCTMIYSLM